jgi:glyoxylase-like metal-dependent hydrolase (beta-lactamase superfamily II)
MVEKMRAQIAAAPIVTASLVEGVTMLSGPGGNVVVLAGKEGKVVVDGFVQPAWPQLKSTLDALDGSPIRTLIDTHWHFDHADNNANFSAAGARILAHQNTRKRLSEPHDLLGMHFDPVPTAALPTDTFADRRSLTVNGEQILLAYVPPAHTDTDILVHFTNANVLHMGDVFFNGTYPFIDASTRGNINGMISGADRALQMVNDLTKIVPGHGPLGDRAALQKYRTMLATIRDRVRAEKTKGATLEQVQAAKPTAEFDAGWGKGRMSGNDFVALVYSTLETPR